MRKGQVTALLIVMIVAGTTVQAQIPPGRWEKVEQLQPGTRINVRLDSGERLHGAFKSIAHDSIDITDDSGRDRTIPKPLVQKIESSAKFPDRLCNGSLIGALAGVAVGVAAMIAFGNAKTKGPVHWGNEDASGYLAGAVLVGGGAGAAAGALIDKSINHPQLLYRR